MGRIERENLEGEVIYFEDTVIMLSIIHMEILSRLLYGDLQSGVEGWVGGYKSGSCQYI